MKPFIVSHSNFHLEQFRNSICEPPNLEPSQTVPDMSLSMRELIERYVRGESITVLKGDYNSDSDLPDISRLNQFEKLDMAKALGADIQKAQRRKKDPERSVNFVDRRLEQLDLIPDESK